MGNVSFLVGFGLAGYADYSGLIWYFIFISSFLAAIGYFFVRAPQMHGIVKADGVVAIPKLLLIQDG